MSFKITIQNKVISFPSTSESPNWAPAVVAFAKAVESALAVSTGAYDIAPQIFTIDSYNPGTNININNLTFPPSEVIRVEIAYSVFRSTSSVEVIEGGNITIVYDDTRSATEKWDIVQTRQGDASISFSITDLGQLRFSTTTISGIDHQGFISFRALSVLRS